tara:strand:+ start:45 stop:227 length:183 start_codon:yes stop_codon:yes gene_type:complete
VRAQWHHPHDDDPSILEREEASGRGGEGREEEEERPRGESVLSGETYGSGRCSMHYSLSI